MLVKIGLADEIIHSNEISLYADCYWIVFVIQSWILIQMNEWDWFDCAYAFAGVQLLNGQKCFVIIFNDQWNFTSSV